MSFNAVFDIGTLADIVGAVPAMKYVNERKPFDRLRAFDAIEFFGHTKVILQIDLCWPAMSKRSASNGGEGGIRTPGTLSGTTDFESVTFGHSATSPEKLRKKVWSLRFGKPRLVLAECSATVSVCLGCHSVA